MKINSGVNKNIGNAFYQYFASFTATLSLVISGMHYGWPSPSLPILLDEFSIIPITEDTGYWLANMPMFGALVGCLSASVLVDHLGRRRTIIACAFPYIASWMMIYFATNVELILAARFIAGISDGLAFSAVPIYIGEITEPRIRGFLGSAVSVAWILGMLLIDIIGSYCSLKEAALISCIFPVVLIITTLLVPESPYFLLMKGKTKEATKNLRTLRGCYAIEAELDTIQSAIKEDMARKTNPTAMFLVSSNRKALFVVLILRGAQEFSGDSAITFYTQNIISEAGSSLTADVASIIFFTLELIVTAVASIMVDRIGRRPLLIFSVSGACVSLLTQGIYYYIKICTNIDVTEFSLIPLIALFIFVICFSSGLKIIPMLMLGELFPQDVKAAAVCFVDYYNVALVTCSSKFFQVTRDTFGMHVPFLFFGFFCGIALVPITIYVPETKGKTLQEIQDYFTGRKTVKEDYNGKSSM